MTPFLGLQCGMGSAVFPSRLLAQVFNFSPSFNTSSLFIKGAPPQAWGHREADPASL